MSKISMELIQELIQIAKDGIETIPPILHGKEKPLKIIECGNDPWKEAALKLDTKDLDRLIRGMVLFIRASFPSYYSSVSPVIVLYGCYIKRNPINEPELTRWIVANRVNPYEPFGTVMYPTATTYDEFLSCESGSRLIAIENEKFEAERQKEFRKARVIREREQSTQRIAAAVRRGDLAAVKALLGKGADISCEPQKGQSLVDLADQNGRTVVADYLRSYRIG